MNCASVKAWMRERFDQGLPLKDGFESHFETCDGCRAYVARLHRLDAELARLTVEPPSPRFEAELAARLRGERNVPSRAWVSGLAVVTAIAFVAVGWQLPVVPFLREWFIQFAAWPPDISISESLSTPVVELGREMWTATKLPGLLASVGGPWISAATIGALSVILVGFNVLLRKFGGDSEPGPFHRTR